VGLGCWEVADATQYSILRQVVSSLAGTVATNTRHSAASVLPLVGSLRKCALWKRALDTTRAGFYPELNQGKAMLSCTATSVPRESEL
jgi:hypothetical protein